MEIRLATEKDIPSILALLSQVLEIHASLRPDLFVPGTTKYDANELKEIIGNESTPIYVLCLDSTVVGYAFCRFEAKPVNQIGKCSLYLDDFCIDEECRGQKLGKALFEFVISEAKRRGCHDITLHCYVDNESAAAFYEAMGAKKRAYIYELMLD